VRSNKAAEMGAGMYLSYCLAEGFPIPPWRITITDNIVQDSRFEDPNVGQGGGIFAFQYPYGARRNVVTNNMRNGVYLAEGNPEMLPLNLGEANDFGYNVLMNNGDYELVALLSSVPWGAPCWAVGNYWGWLDTQTMLDHIIPPPGLRRFYYDPVAASGKWFDVATPSQSLCETGVIASGDVSVMPGVSLQFAPGVMIQSLTTSDYSVPGGHPFLNDIFVRGPGGALLAQGEEQHPIVFTSWRWNEPHMPGDWYGIHIDPSASGSFDWCNVNSAYTGISAVNNSSLSVTNCHIENELFAGIVSDNAWATIQDNTIGWCQIYGIRCNNLRSGTWVKGNMVHHIQMAGISCDALYETGQSTVIHNNIDGSGPSTLRTMQGIELRNVGPALMVDSNTVNQCLQAGICEDNSSAFLFHNLVFSSQFDGLRCQCFATPRMRWSMIAACANGVYCDPTSQPDLGTTDDWGNNQILMDNVVWVHGPDNTVLSVWAQYNWWGTPEPDHYPEKFVNSVIYYPWLMGPPVGGGMSNGTQVVSRNALVGCSPNPFAANTRVAYQLAQPSQVGLAVYDAAGRLVRTLASGNRPAGSFTAVWDGRDERGKTLPGGIYLCRLDLPGFREIKKVVVAR